MEKIAEQTAKDAIIEHIHKLLKTGQVKGVLALSDKDGQIGPHLFTSNSDLELLSLGDKDKPGDTRYPLVRLIRPIVEAYPTETFGVLVRGCDERALNRLRRESIYLPGQILTIGFSCPEELAVSCQCTKPWPDKRVWGEETKGVKPEELITPGKDINDNIQEWFDTFDRCMMCFGCRNICPVCSCKECTFADETFIPQRQLPTSRNFLMTRAVHMVDRCVYCGLCEQTCPADIPLKSLYRMVAKLIGRPTGKEAA
jgi:formate dehydrogenase subunit beta